MNIFFILEKKKSMGLTNLLLGSKAAGLPLAPQINQVRVSTGLTRFWIDITIVKLRACLWLLK